MTAPLDGVRVLEVASWLAAPSCAALMADMGAQVIKVEPPGGDTYRRTMQGLFGEDFIHPSFQFDNRGKRGVCVDLESPDGLELVHRLARDADVFITNLTAPRLAKYRLTDKDVHALAPTAIYAVLAGYGVTGPDSQRQAFDQSAFWARSGAMSVFGDRDDGPLISRGGFGDRTTCLNLLAAILAAMRLRDRTGEGQYVEVTLQRTGIWALASDVTATMLQKVQPEKTSHKAPGNPIWNFYTTSDGRHLVMIMPAALPYWPKFCAMIGKPEWITDARFQTLLGLAEHAPDVVPEIAAMFAAHDLAYWRKKLDAAGLIWEPAATLPEVIEDPALRAAGAFATIVHRTGGAMEIIAAPFHIRGGGVEVRGPAPDAGQHTREVFTEAGIPRARIDELIAKGVLVQRD
jgi:crotonobetainyl-CoA:carnitine CoA-transferase CaiB-like acyl-CoA transferase